VRPPKYDGRERNGYSLIRANKLVYARYAKDPSLHGKSARQRLAALIGRHLLSNGLVQMTQYKAPPGPEGTENVIVEGIAEVRWPDGWEADSVIQDLDPAAYYGEALYRPQRPARSARSCGRDRNRGWRLR
jgi:hypothetical protein